MKGHYNLLENNSKFQKISGDAWKHAGGEGSSNAPKQETLWVANSGHRVWTVRFDDPRWRSVDPSVGPRTVRDPTIRKAWLQFALDAQVIV